MFVCRMNESFVTIKIANISYKSIIFHKNPEKACQQLILNLLLVSNVWSEFAF